MKTILIVIAAILILGGGAFALTRKSDKPAATNTTTSTNTDTNSASDSPAASTPTQTDDQNSATTITYTDSGFSPKTMTVKSGTTVTIKNASSGPLQFDSNPHPEHTDNPELNVGVIASGQSKTFTVTKTGTFGYHNHLNDSDRGTIVVE
jgi:plastocyanin